METRRKYKPFLKTLLITQQIGIVALVVFGITSEMVYRRYRITEHRIINEPGRPTCETCCTCRYYDNRGIPYYYRTQNTGDTIDPIFYYDTPIEMPVNRKEYL